MSGAWDVAANMRSSASATSSVGTFRRTRGLGEDPSSCCYPLPGRRFSHVPTKYRPEVSLPPVAPLPGCGASAPPLGGLRRTRSEATTGRTRGFGHTTAGSSGAGWLGRGSLRRCFGDFCDAKLRLPPSLLDLETPQDAFHRQARALCRSEAKGADGKSLGAPLFTADEMVACLREDRRKAGRELEAGPLNVDAAEGTTTVSVCMIIEARAYPRLCRWLADEVGWSFDRRNPEFLAAAAQRLREDTDGSTDALKLLGCSGAAALRYRLRMAPACRTCACAYAAVHDIVTLLKGRRRDLLDDAAPQRQSSKTSVGEESRRCSGAGRPPASTLWAPRPSRALGPRPSPPSTCSRAVAGVL